MVSFKSSSKELTIEEEYIDMEITSSNTLLSTNTSSSSQKHKEFEFQMSSSILSSEEDRFVPSADELFYRGKLLPLHLPPRLKMVQNILHTAIDDDSDLEEETFTIPFMSLTAPCTNSNTPVDQSRNISPSESCRVSCDEDQFWSTQVASVLIAGQTSKKSTPSWSTKLKQSSLGKKLVRASRAYLKSLFLQKSESATCPKRPANAVNADSPTENIIADQRKSFSGVIQRHNSALFNSNSSSGSSSSSSSFSLSSNGSSSYDLQWLKRCSSASLDLETSIEGAIAHCKQSLISQQLLRSMSKTNKANQTLHHLPNFPMASSRIAI